LFLIGLGIVIVVVGAINGFGQYKACVDRGGVSVSGQCIKAERIDTSQ